MEIVNIPKERVAILIGEEGKTKERIEKRTGVKLEIRDGEVTLEGSEEKVYFAKDIIKAIGRGFKPGRALLLAKDDYSFVLISLKDYYHTKSSIRRIKGRIIGEEGKIRKEIEVATDSYLSIYGHTVGIIAKYDTIAFAEEAIHKLIGGCEHSTLINYLSDVRKTVFNKRLV